MPVFSTVLVANRGEIAMRIISTLDRLGIRSVAVHSDADAGAPFVRAASTAVRIGPAPAAESYLRVEAIIDAARSTGADAIHPGYGFLSESTELARACAETDIVFIGPGVHALEVMGDKATARAHVAAHGVPIVPGFDATGLDDTEIAARAQEVGFPLLVKPSAGGGGKGMEIVRDAAGLSDALAGARRVARAAFGDESLVLERLIARPRHIEVQVLGDVHGRTIALGERECTLQRRHQKVIEEAPAPHLAGEVRERMLETAVRAAESVAYVGAGTVEFLLDADAPDRFWFIEMNTRLQVEHPVTEAVTGLDLVEQQVRIACGEAVPAAPAVQGHAFEARVYAESPERGFLPSTGTVLRFDRPSGVRVDAAVVAGSQVTAHYDPMIAKVITHGPDRMQALGLLDRALAETVVLGVETNIAFLRTLCADGRVREGEMDTGLIGTLEVPTSHEVHPAAVAAAAAAVQERQLPSHTQGQQDDVWSALSGWRLHRTDPVEPQVRFLTDADEIVSAAPAQEAYPLATAVAEDGAVWVSDAGSSLRLRPLSRRAASRRRAAALHPTGVAASPECRAPMPGAVVALPPEDRARVTAGQPLVVIEAMKMEHPVVAPHDGTVHLLVGIGDQVRRDQPVARVIEEDDDD